MLWAAYVLYQADKQIYAVVLPLVRAELGLSGYEAGLVNSAFTVVSAILAPLAGALGDRWPKHRVLFAAVAIWSIATILTGFATSLALLLLIRAVMFAGAEVIEQTAGVVTLTLKEAALVRFQLVAGPLDTADSVTVLV